MTKLSYAQRLAQRLPALALALLLLLPTGALGSRFELWPYEFGLLLVAISMAGSLLVQIINTLWLLQKPAPAVSRPLRRACLYALPPLAIVATYLRHATTGMDMVDVSTDTQTPPAFETLLPLRDEHAGNTSYSAKKTAAQSRRPPALAPINNSLAADENFQQALASVQALGWKVVASRQLAGEAQIEAIATSFWFGLKSDISIRCRDGRIDMRSASRHNQSDFGRNAKYLDAFQQTFEKLSS